LIISIEIAPMRDESLRPSFVPARLGLAIAGASAFPSVPPPQNVRRPAQSRVSARFPKAYREDHHGI